MVPPPETAGKCPNLTTMKFYALIIAALSALFLSSCNTMEGVGRDMQAAGSSMERTASGH